MEGATAKFNTRETYLEGATAKFNTRETQKFRGFFEPRNLVPAKFSTFKVIVSACMYLKSGQGDTQVLHQFSIGFTFIDIVDYTCTTFIIHQIFIYIYICFCLCLYTLLGTGPVKFECFDGDSDISFRNGFIDSFVTWVFDYRSNYRVHMVSYFKPSQSGKHRFFANYDDKCKVYLSENNKEAGKEKIIDGSSGTNYNLLYP